MKKLTVENSALLVIDIQEKLFPIISNKEEILKNTSILLKGAKELSLKTLITEQYPKGLGHTIAELNEDIKGFDIEEKTSFSVYVDNKNKLDEFIKSGVNNFIISGIESHICVYQTAKELLDNNLSVYIVYDATGSRDINNHRQILDTLASLGAVIIPTESILFELLSSAKHQSFKAISKLIK